MRRPFFPNAIVPELAENFGLGHLSHPIFGIQANSHGKKTVPSLSASLSGRPVDLGRHQSNGAKK